MKEPAFARAILLADGIGCGIAALITLLDERPTRAVDPSGRSRVPITWALAATCALLVSSASRGPHRQDLTRAACLNAAWVTGCLTTLATAPLPRRGRHLVALTAVLDGLAAVLQWRLRSGDISDRSA